MLRKREQAVGHPDWKEQVLQRTFPCYTFVTRIRDQERRRGPLDRSIFQNSLFRDLSQEVQDRLIVLTRSKKCQNNQLIFSKGEPAESLMAVRSGGVKILNYAPNGKEIIFRILKPGKVFGEIAMIDGGGRTAEARAVGTTELQILDRREFLSVLANSPELSLGLLQILCGRLRSTSEQLEDFTFLDLKSRLAKCLAQLGEQRLEFIPDGKDIEIKVSQQVLAAMMGTTREAVNKRLREWEDEGLISLGRGAITLHNLGVLKAVS